jgi:hypothetical protein
MAGTAELKNVMLPNSETIDSTGEFITPAAGDALLCIIDLYSNGRVLVAASLPFADYTGLQTEWEAGTATTVLEAAIDSWLDANTDGGLSDPLTGAQRSVIGYDYVIS